MPRKLQAVQTFWKLRTWRLSQVRGPFENPADYLNDVDNVRGRVQNEARVPGPVQDPASEDICVLVRGVSTSRHTRLVKWNDQGFGTGVLKTGGGVDEDDQNWSLEWDAVSYAFGDFPNNPFAVGTIFRIEDEICTITSLTPGVGQAFTATVRRGDHGTDNVAHAVDTPIRILRPSVPMKIHTLSEVLSGIPAPSNLVAQAKPETIRLTWDQNLDATQLAKLKETVVYWSTSSPVTTGDSSIIVPGKKAEYTFFAPDNQTYYFAVAQRPYTGADSALSNEANAARSIVDVLDPSKPAAPTTGAQGVGGGPSQGWLIRIAAQMAAADISAGVGGEMIQVQVAGPGYTHEPDSTQPSSGFLTGLVNRLDGTAADEEIDGRRIDVTWTFKLSSSQLGGPYYVSARIYNPAGAVWSDWSTPVEALTQAGQPDSAPPSVNTDGLFTILDASGAAAGIGNAIQARVRIPSANQFSIWGFDLQATDDLGDWDETLDTDPLGVTSIDVNATGDIVTGQLQMTNVSPALSAGAHAGKAATFYDLLVFSGGKYTGEIQGLWYSNLVDTNGTDTLTIKPGNPAAWPETKNNKPVSIFASTAWNFYKHRETYVLQDLRSDGLKIGAGEYVTPPIPISESCYFRMRWHNQTGVGRWFYFKVGASEGTTDQAQASQFTPAKIQSLAIGTDQVLGTHIAPDQVENSHIAPQAVAALELAKEIKPPTVASGDPSGAPAATEADWYYRDDAPAGVSPFWYWNGASWSNDPDTFPDDVMATSGIIAGYVAAGAIRAASAIVDGILAANHIVADGLTLQAGQDIEMILDNSDPSELRFGAATGKGMHLFAQGTGNFSFINPQTDQTGHLGIGSSSVAFGNEGWQQISLNASHSTSAQIDAQAIDGLGGIGSAALFPNHAQLRATDGTQQSQVILRDGDIDLATTSGVSVFFYDKSTETLTLQTALASNVMELDAALVHVLVDAQFDGFVAIGATVPAKICHIKGTTQALRVEDEQGAQTSIGIDHHGIEMVTGTVAGGRYLSALKWMSDDADFTTTSPKLIAYIAVKSTEAYTSDTRGGSSLVFAVNPNNPGASPIPVDRMVIDQGGDIGIGQLSSLAPLAGQRSVMIASPQTGSERTDLYLKGRQIGSDSNVGALHVYNAGNRIGSINVARSGSDMSGEMTFFTWDAGSPNQTLTLEPAGDVSVLGRLTAGSLAGSVLDDNSLAALQLASELKPPKVASGAPSGAPGATEGPWYHRTDTDPPTLYYWNGSSWSSNPDTWPDGPLASAGIIAGYLSVGAVRASAMIVDGIITAAKIAANQIDAGHIVAGGLSLQSGQDIEMILDNSDPSELRFGAATGKGMHLFAQGTGDFSFINPQTDQTGHLGIGSSSVAFGNEGWQQISLNASHSTSARIDAQAIDGLGGIGSADLTPNYAELRATDGTQQSQVILRDGDIDLATTSGVSVFLYDKSSDKLFLQSDTVLLRDSQSSVASGDRRVIAHKGFAVQANNTANSQFFSIMMISNDCELDFSKVGTATPDELRFKYDGTNWLVYDGALISISDSVRFTQDVEVVGNVGFFDKAPVAKDSAFSQTAYSTATRTVPDPGTYGGFRTVTQSSPWGFSTEAMADSITDDIADLWTALTTNRKLINALIDTLQHYGLI